MRVATLDVGTNSILLLVAEGAGRLGPGAQRRVGREVRVIEDRCRIEGLGRGVDRTGALGDEAVARGLDAIREYAEVIRAARVDRVAAVGTQALREARNGAAFLEPAGRLLGVPVEVIGGRREAELAFRAVVCSMPDLGRGALLVFDVGGGSTEFVSGAGGAVGELASVPIGAVRLSERFLAGDPPRPDEVRAMIAAIDAALAGAPVPAGVPLVGTAGTATTLAAVALGLARYDPDRVQGMRVARAEVERQLARYLELTVAERRRIPGLEPKRADTIPAGAAIVARVLDRAGADGFVVSDRGVRWGLAYELLGAA